MTLTVGPHDDEPAPRAGPIACFLYEPGNAEPAPCAPLRVEGSVVWVDVQHGADCGEVAELLRPLGLDKEMVRDLLDRDLGARLDALPDSVRHVTMIGLGIPESWRRQEAADHRILIQMVEVIVGDGWVVTCWHESRDFDGTARADLDQPPLQRLDPGTLGTIWAAKRLESAGDLATAVAGQLALGYKFAYRALDCWIQQWEHHIHSSEHISRERRNDLKQLLALVNEARRHLAAFNNARSLAPDGRWFPVENTDFDAEVDGILDKTLDRLRMLFEGIRANLDLISMETLALQSEMAAARAQSEAKFQEGVGRITALLLVPTLIAGIYGANTWLPGGGAKWGFESMVVSMVIASTLVYWLIVRNPAEYTRAKWRNR